MSWRDEINTALAEWVAVLGGEQGGERWQRVGTARPTGEPGRYVVDVRGSELTADQVDNLRLGGPEKQSLREAFPVTEATIDGELLRIRVAEFATPADPHVWRLRQAPTFLVTSLRDELAALADGGLANLLARGEVGGRLASVITLPALLPAQRDAYRACLGQGLWLVWGPPGTGKTRVLRAAISDLIEEGKRVLLVSGTNIAVDNALLGVVRERRHQPGIAPTGARSQDGRPASAGDGPPFVVLPDSPFQSFLELGALPSAVPCARLHARQIVWEWGRHELVNAVELIVSELITNGLRASEGITGSRYAGRWTPGVPPVRLWLHSEHKRIVIQVWDGNDKLPIRQVASLSAEGGRGLLLVESVSASWGSYQAEGSSGKVVWAVVGSLTGP